jgi:diketogulonate reductase-like aldo/keto reductase
VEFSEVVPAVNQVETHIFNQQVKAHEIMKKYNTQIESWGPFAEGKNNLFTNSTLQELGDKYNKSTAQVALRFLIQRDVVVIPKTVNKNRMEENINVFDFKLTAEEMEKIAALDTGESLFFSHYDPQTVEYIINLGK